MDKIIDGLYLGGYDDATKSDILIKKNITHVLTVHELKLSSNFSNPFQYMFVETKLDQEIDLLSQFLETNEFIDNGIKSGGVLVHCQYGMARSATLVIAYIMSIRKYTVHEVFEFVKSKRRIICPSDSFMHQLRFFEFMEYKLDLSLQIYRLYKNFFTISNKLDKSNLVLGKLNKNKSNYKCSKCKSDLFNEENINFHLSEEHEIDFILSNFFESLDENDGKNCKNNNICIELMDWMNFHSNPTGDVNCPECNTKLGKYCINGEYCHCGIWIFPAVFIDRLRIIE